MKKIIKNNLIAIIIFIIVGIYVSFSTFVSIKEQKKMDTNRNSSIEYCQNELQNSDEDEFREYCNKIISQKDIEVDSYTVISDVLLYRVHFLNGISFLLICIPTLFYLSKIIRNKYLINYLLRDSYKNFMRFYLRQAYKYFWILPVISGMILLPCFMIFSGNPTYSQTFGTAIWTSNIVDSPLIFIMLYLCNVILYSFIFINISIIIVRKCYNYFSAVLLSFLSYLGIELFFEVFVNLLISQVLFDSTWGRLFNIMNFFTFSDQHGTIPLILFTFLVFIISCIGVYFSYKNKEKFIIDCEKEKK